MSRIQLCTQQKDSQETATFTITGNKNICRQKGLAGLNRTKQLSREGKPVFPCPALHRGVSKRGVKNRILSKRFGSDQ